MYLTEALKDEMRKAPLGEFCPDYFRAKGYQSGTAATPAGKRADGIAALLTAPTPHIYQNDLIAGSMRPLFVSLSDTEREAIRAAVAPYPERRFLSNKDHYAPDYKTVLTVGIGGLLSQIAASKKAHANDPSALDMLDAMAHTLQALQDMLRAYAAKATTLMGSAGYDDARLAAIAKNCLAVADHAPKSFAEGLQLLWMIHLCFVYEERHAMAFGRWDQLLYPLYQHDVACGVLTEDKATALLENVFVKICERRFYRNADDVVNICIGGVDEAGNDAVNDLSYRMLEAVRAVNLPGPNLSARIAPDTPDAFLDACLKVIGTGLGYPALMNDTVNMAALRRYGYEEKDVRNYSMVGCIENFITGQQPPWSDGRFDTPRFLEYLLLDGEGNDKNRKGLKPPPLSEITSMDAFMRELERQLANGVREYIDNFNAKNLIRDAENYTSPFLSCFCKPCIERGRDINMGGAKYPSVHGAALMGVGTMSDALAAIEQTVFIDKTATLAEIAEAMRQNFAGHEDLRSLLLAAPKYGNDHPLPDKYAVWFTAFLANEFDKYRTYDGGGIYIAMAANVSNIDAGHRIGATPDGRLAGEPLSDAASPTYGRDLKGITATLLSLSKPDYTRCACGTVVNQKLSPSMFEDGQRQNLISLIRVYFAKGGQEIQINATSTDTLKDAMEHPERYASLVVRVSGFSALYVTLDKEVQEDILRRTQHNN